MARSTQRKRFRAWSRARGLDLNGCQETAFKVWLHCKLENKQTRDKAREMLLDIRRDLEALYGRGLSDDHLR